MTVIAVMVRGEDDIQFSSKFLGLDGRGRQLSFITQIKVFDGNFDDNLIAKLVMS